MCAVPACSEAELSVYSVSVVCSEDEERLVADLFFGYNKLIRPVENMTKTVQVEFGLAFIQLISVVSTHSMTVASFW